MNFINIAERGIMVYRKTSCTIIKPTIRYIIDLITYIHIHMQNIEGYARVCSPTQPEIAKSHHLSLHLMGK